MEKPVYSSSVPAPLTFYRGGLNIGIFYPGSPVSPIGSEIFGNIFGGDPAKYRTESLTPGERDYAWVLIIAPEDKLFQMASNDVVPSRNSEYDGLFNKNNNDNLGKALVNSYKKGNYKDWYLPSADELAFIANNLPKNFSLDFRFKEMKNKFYATSTYERSKLSENQGFILTQSFFSTTYGVTKYIPQKREMFARYVKKVPVYIT